MHKMCYCYCCSQRYCQLHVDWFIFEGMAVLGPASLCTRGGGKDDSRWVAQQLSSRLKYFKKCIPFGTNQLGESKGTSAEPRRFHPGATSGRLVDAAGVAPQHELPFGRWCISCGATGCWKTTWSHMKEWQRLICWLINFCFVSF